MATESFFSNASLAYLASAGAGKDGKTYSIKPTDGTGDFTFSRGSNLAATRVGADGLIEKGRENLLLQSNQFDTTWGLEATTLTSGQTGYDGSSDAWKVIPITDNSTHYVYKTTPYQTGVSTFSVYAKYSGYHAQLRVFNIGGGKAYANFDLQNGTKGTSGGTDIIDSTITSVGNGWYRITLSLNYTIAPYSSGVIPIESPTDGEIPSYAGDGTSGVLIQDFQHEVGLAATDYIETGASTAQAGLLEDEPRFDYSGGATCPSLLLEPSRTQLVSYSEYPTVFFGSDIELTTSPDGSLNAAKIIEQNTNSQHFVTFTALNVVASTTYAISFYCKKGSYSSIYVPLQSSKINANLSINFDTQSVTLAGPDSVINSEFIESVENGWYRVGFSATANSSGTMDFYACISTSLSSYQGDGTSYTEFYGFQLEQGSYPTSYIPNHSGGSVTRGADAMDEQISGLTSLDKGTFFVDFDRGLTTATARDVSTQGLYYETLNTFAGLNQGIEIGTNADGSIRAAVRTSSGFSSLYTNNTLSRFKILYKWSGTELKVFVNGSSVYSNSTKWGEITSALQYIGYNADFRKSVNQVLVFPEALSDADCIALTTL